MKSRTLLLLVALLSAGCGGKAVLKTENPQAQVPAKASSNPSGGPQAPTLVDIHLPVADADYQTAFSQTGSSDVNRHNVESFLTVAQYQYNHSNMSDALKTYQKILTVSNLSPLADKAQYMVGQIYYEKKDYLPALSAFQSVEQKFPKSTYKGQSRQMMEFMLSYSLSLEDLKSFVSNYPDSPLKCSALFQLGSRESQSGMQSEAMEHLNEFTQQCPQHPSFSAAQLLSQSLQSQQQGKTWKVGVLVPKTGRFKAFGDSVLNGVTLAIEQANQAGGLKKPMSVLVRDTMGDSMQAVKVFQDLTADDSLDALIGPVVGNEIEAVAPLDNQKRITLISPSISRDGMSSLGPYIFSNSMTNEMQGRAIAKYAVEHLGYKRFAMLAPDDGYGETLSDAFQKTVASMGATVTNSETYTPSVTDFQKQLIALGGQNPQSSKENDLENNRRMDELKYAIGKEIGKIFLKAKEVTGDSAPVSAPTPAVAFAPFVEALTNTTCPSVAKNVNDDIQEFLKAQTDYVIRNTDLVQQAMTRLPVEFKGTTLPVSADQWTEIAPDIQASLIVTGRIVETNPPNDWSDHPTFDYIVGFDAFQLDPKKNAFVKIYQGYTKYNAFKPTNLVRANSTYQALYLPAHSVEIPSLAAQIHFYDLNPVLLGGHLWQNDTALTEGAKDMEGAYFVTGFYVDSQQGTVKKFVDDYMKRFAKRPDLLAAQAYDAARLLLQATAASSSRDDIHNQLLNIKDFDGVSGKTTFGGHGEAEKVVPVLRIQGGKYQQVQ